VRTAIKAAQARLKLYTKVPPHGLALFVGVPETIEGKGKKLCYAFEPHRPVRSPLYHCDDRFHTGPLDALIRVGQKIGFLIIDGNGALYATLADNEKEVLSSFSVDLPNKHGRGGQSAVRFARIRHEKRHNFLRKAAETATQLFVESSSNKPKIAGLVLAGSANLKVELQKSHFFHPALLKIVVGVFDTHYGGRCGFSEAIELSASTLGDAKLAEEKRLIAKFFEEIAADTGKYVYSVPEVLEALKIGAVNRLLVWEDMDLQRVVLKCNSGHTPRSIVRVVAREDVSSLVGALSGNGKGPNAVLARQEPLAEWLVENCGSFGAKVSLVTSSSQEGFQFCKGFGGLGGFLRWAVDLTSLVSDGDSL